MKRIGLVPKLITAIILGVIIGSYMPEMLVRILVTFADFFASFLKFIIPLMIIGFVVVGIADLGRGAGKLLVLTTCTAYCSTIVAGALSYLMASSIFPLFISSAVVGEVDPEAGMVKALFHFPISPVMNVGEAIVFAFVVGFGISVLRHRDRGEMLYSCFKEFSQIITVVLESIIIPLLPVYICGTFSNMAYSGEVAVVLSIFWRVFLLVIALHLAYLLVCFLGAGIIGGRNPLVLMRNQIPGYLTAVGTQSSAATIPVNLSCAEHNGVSKGIREFVIPLCATIHLCGSMITITGCVVAVLMMNGMSYGLGLFLPFLLTLGVAMVAAPGAPGGAIMAALPFLTMVGIPTEGAMASMLIALYITQDSFGTAANVSGDNAIAVIMDTIYHKVLKDAD